MAGVAPAPRAAEAVVDETCGHILSVVRASHVTVNRDLLERMEGLAKANPGILAPPASARKARDISGRVGDWPVVENKGLWFVLENRGHPASDGFFRVSVVDVENGRLVGHISDVTGNAPVATAAVSSEAVEVAALAWLLSKDTPIGDLDVAKQGVQRVLLKSKAAFPAHWGGVKLISDDGKLPGLVVALSVVQASAYKATITVTVEHRDEQGQIAPDGSSCGEFEFALTDGTWTHTKTLKHVIK